MRTLHLVVKGTNFQIQVWRALLAVPPGAMVTYQDVAGYVSTPAATRVVANALAKNPIGYIIPCHRVISKVGKAHRYRWGAVRKKAIIGWEASRYQAQP
jgi:AraC family transcriptional regulator of adaptative response/methylated-DNA-[protein]-cysteine methyltransferase